jgi:hypothetical protein
VDGKVHLELEIAEIESLKIIKMTYIFGINQAHLVGQLRSKKDLLLKKDRSAKSLPVIEGA